MQFSRIRLKTFIDVLDAVSWNQPCTLEKVLLFTGLSRPPVSKALKNAIEMGVIHENNKKYIIKDEFDKQLSFDSKKIVLRNFLNKWEVFQKLCYFMAISEGHNEAIRKTIAYLNLDIIETESVGSILQLGLDLGVFNYSGDEYILNDTIKCLSHETDLLPANLNSEMAVKVFLIKMMTPELFYSLDKPEQDKLTESLLYYNTDPEKSCSSAGQALENYLRVIGNNEEQDLSSYDGIGQLTDFLAGKTRLIIHPKHRDIAKSISTIRNSSAHDRDKLTSDPWIKTSDTALANIILVIQLIKSINLWLTTKGQII